MCKLPVEPKQGIPESLEEANHHPGRIGREFLGISHKER
jgi:hypothetical protein